MTRQEKLLLILLAGLNFTHILDFIIMMPLGNYLIGDLHITAFQFSLLVAVYSISAFFSGLAIATFIDRFDRKKPLLFAYIGFLAGTIACGFANSFVLLLLARIMAGTFGGIIGAQIFAIVADLFPYEKRGRAMGIVMGGFAIASILGVPISLFVINLFHHDWHLPFLMIGAVGIILVPLIIRIVPNMTGHIREVEEDNLFGALFKVTRIKIQRSALCFSGLLMMGHFLIIPFINPYLEFNKGFSKDALPNLYLIGGMASLVAALYLGRMADKKGKLKVFSISILMSMVMVWVVTQMPPVAFGLVLLFFALFFMVATGRIVTAQAMITQVVNPEQRGSFMSINGSIQQLGSGIAALCAGAIVRTQHDHKILHYEYVGYLSILVLLLTWLFAKKIFRNLDNNAREVNS
ncbi:MAG: MFS transporter [Chitinophagaceae bacterium]|nr:MFS transporter [Chitinophagaceae bacterium]